LNPLLKLLEYESVKKQTVETVINEETILFAKYLRNEQ